MAFVVAAVGTALMGGYQIYAGERANRQQEAAQADAKRQAALAAQQADIAFNKANGKRPNLSGIFGANLAQAGQGVGGTLLTGPTGASTPAPLLGKTTLLGG